MKWLILVLPGLVMLTPANAASFDCSKASTMVEKTICSDDELSRLDEQLAALYREALVAKMDHKALRQSQREWIARRNGCKDRICVNRLYAERISILHKWLNHLPDHDGKYHFTLSQGKGVPVCEAYLERLNATRFEAPPYCGRPESTTVKGFVRLNRVPLSSNDVRDLYSILQTFMGNAANKKVDWSDMQLQQHLAQAGQFRLSQSGVASLQKDLDSNLSQIWRFDPPIDIDNDGKPENIEVWAGDVLGNVQARPCGADMADLFPDAPPLRQPQLAFAVTANGTRLDVSNTEKIFGHPLGGYPIFMGGKWTVSDNFRPIGTSIGIFEYGGLYYFDTFFDGWGDFAGKRRKAATIENTLGVFLNKDGKTRQVCEYRMRASRMR